MEVQIKQNPYSGRWDLRPNDAVSRLRFREEESGFTNETIAMWMGRDWFQNYMHGAFGTGVWLVAHIPDNTREVK